MRKQRFTGPMGQWMQQHLAFRRSLGFLYRSVEYDLDGFDQYLVKHFPSCQTISLEMIVGYLDSRRDRQPISQAMCVSNLRQFCRFMLQVDPNTYIPEKFLIGSAKSQMKPHIFTEEEIVKLIEQAKKLIGKNELLPHTYVIIIGLLWVTGMRIGEVVRLKVEDVNLIEGIINVQQTKFFKSRLIPLSASSVNALITYKNQRASFGYSEDPATPFFLNDRRKTCAIRTTSKTIKELMIRAGIKTIQGKTPRVHDIRHSFATRWLLDFYQAKKDPTAYLPVLATYMGHTNIANTQVYLHPSIELLNLAGQQLQSYILSTSGDKL